MEASSRQRRDRVDIALAGQHIFILNDKLTPDDIRQRAMDKRTGAFGSGLGACSSARRRTTSSS
jgi:hypothetical protein